MVGHRLAVIIFKIFKCGNIVTVIDTIAILVRSDYIVFRFRKIMLITAVQAQTHIFLGPVLKSVIMPALLPLVIKHVIIHVERHIITQIKQIA